MITFPPLFEKRTTELLGEEFAQLKLALTDTAPVSIRLNNKKSDAFSSADSVPWCEQAYYLEKRPVFTADPLFHAGAYYVQEASSMFLQEMVRQLAPNARCVLDLCAAPGGKSTLLSQFISPDSLLVSNEIVRSRSMILAENLIKWGNSNIVVTNNKPADFQRLPAIFDLMVVDAPCSGEGMFRKDPGAINEWSLANIQQCTIRQKQILDDAWDALKTGGILIYSTCTYNKEENEANIAYIIHELGAELLSIDCSRFEGIVDSGLGYRFYPHRIKGEGFFIAAIRKSAPAPPPMRIKEERNKAWKETKLMQNALLNPENFAITDDEQHLYALPSEWKDTIMTFRTKLNCLVSGIQLAERKGNNLIPSHQLALSKQLHPDFLNRVELDNTTAIKYLQRESIVIEDAPRGYVLICFQGLPLGWVKNLGNRSNNLYPQHWRIRMKL
jgi:16S rRNA C967 or C1407 C5-methylase (RsmB/RsmF family)/NOL1/NOP2/fmu family ribosome biogenesis protein